MCIRNSMAHHCAVSMAELSTCRVEIARRQASECYSVTRAANKRFHRLQTHTDNAHMMKEAAGSVCRGVPPPILLSGYRWAHL